MASVETRGNSHRVIWRLNGEKEYTSWPTVDLAEEAKDLVEARRGRITAEQVYSLMGVVIEGAEEDGEEADLTPTFRDWSETWLKSKTRIGPSTRGGYAAQLRNRVWPAVEDKRLHELPPSFWGQFLNDLKEESKDEPGLEHSTATRYFTLVNAIMAAAVHDGLIGDNPLKFVDFEPDQTEHDDTGEIEQVRLTKQEYAALAGAFGEEDRPLVDLLGGTGCRWSEGTALSVGHIVPPTRGQPPKVRVWRAWKRDERGRQYLGTTKGRRRRELGITLDLWETLEPLCSGRDPDELLIVGPSGGQLVHADFVRWRWNPAVVRAGRCPEHPPPDRGTPREPGGGQVRPRCRDYGGTNDAGQPCGAVCAVGWDRCVSHIGPLPDAVSLCGCPGLLLRRPTPHDLRHTHAAWLFSDPRVTVLAISRRLGHAQLATTSEIYGDLMPETEDAVLAALGDLAVPL